MMFVLRKFYNPHHHEVVDVYKVSILKIAKDMFSLP